MATLSVSTERLLAEFSRGTGVTQDQVENLRSAIAGSPALATQVDTAIAAGHLQNFALLPSGTNAGGTYDGHSKTINLPARILSTESPPNDRRPAELTFVLGHEVQHSFNHAETRRAYTRFETALGAAARGNHDYTEAIDALLSTNRSDEAASNLAGWNALAGMVKAANPAATLADVYAANPRAQDFARRSLESPTAYVTHSDLIINEDLSITATADNIEGMAKHYFDKSPHLARLGHNGNSDYTNYYGAYAVGRASQYEALNPAPGGIPPMTINMQQLGLQESLLEQNGISLGEGNPPPQPYLDSGTTPPSLHHFDHTATTHTHIPIAAQGIAAPPAQSVDGTARTAQPVKHHDAAPPIPNEDRGLHEQIRGKVAALDAAHGRSFDATSERLSASLLVLAKENGLDRVDHVVLSGQTSHAPAAQNIFVVMGALDDPAALRASTPTVEAAQRPVQESLDHLAAFNQQQTDHASQELAQQHAQEQQRGGPSR